MLLKKNIHRKISFLKPPGCRGERRGTGKGKWEAQIYPAIGDKAKASIQVSNLLEVIVPFNSTHREVHVLNSWGVGLRSLPLAKVTWHLHTACTQTRPSTLCLSVPFHNQLHMYGLHLLICHSFFSQSLWLEAPPVQHACEGASQLPSLNL